MKGLIFVYRFLFYLIAPLVIALLPVAVVLLTGNEAFAWLMLVSYPAGIASVFYFWPGKLFRLLEEIE